MSLVMAIANKEGIVVSADWRLILHRADNPFIAMPSDHSQKAYITNLRLMEGWFLPIQD